MTQHSDEPMPTPPLQFDVVEAAAAAQTFQPALACVVCRRPITDLYYAVRDKTICADCCGRIMAQPQAPGPLQILLALLYGTGAGLAGAAVWFAIRRFAHAEIGIVAVAVGYAVGKAMIKGAGGRGGKVMQVMAVLLTYFCIAMNYLPDFLQPVFQQLPLRQLPLPVIGAIAAHAMCYALKAPFDGGIKNILGLLIIGFALWEAWRFTAARPLPLTGPYRVGPQNASLSLGVRA